MFSSNQDLVIHLERTGVLHSAKIKNALYMIDRKDFVPQEQTELAYADNALLLAEEQTISQPTTVAFMLELLNVQQGNKVLDIGAGSGWVSCLLGHLVGEKGNVFAYEVNEKVGKMGKKNVEKNKLKNVDYQIADAAEKWKESAPYDRIYAGAAFKRVPRDLLRQLAVGGVLVAPTQEGYVEKHVRKNEKEFSREGHYGFVFVPFVSK